MVISGLPAESRGEVQTVSEIPEPQNSGDENSPMPAEAAESSAERTESEQSRYEHDDSLVDEWEDESFPASDPPGHY